MFFFSFGALICFILARGDQPTSATTIRKAVLAGLILLQVLSRPMVALISLASHVAMALDLTWESVMYVQLLPYSCNG